MRLTRDGLEIYEKVQDTSVIFNGDFTTATFPVYHAYRFASCSGDNPFGLWLFVDATKTVYAQRPFRDLYWSVDCSGGRNHGSAISIEP